jgi:hypothetical protein
MRTVVSNPPERKEPLLLNWGSNRSLGHASDSRGKRGSTVIKEVGEIRPFRLRIRWDRFTYRWDRFTDPLGQATPNAVVSASYAGGTWERAGSRPAPRGAPPVPGTRIKGRRPCA